MKLFRKYYHEFLIFCINNLTKGINRVLPGKDLRTRCTQDSLYIQAQTAIRKLINKY